MSTPYDATTKDLIETDPAGWVAFLGGTAPASAVGLIDADLSTVSTATDKVIRVDEPFRWLLHLDIQTGADATIERRLMHYGALLHTRHGVPVASVVVLLRKKGNMKWLTGHMPHTPPIGPSWEFRYQVVRVWERSPAEFLAGPLGLLPLAPLAGVSGSELPNVVGEMKARIDTTADRPLAAKLWGASYVLMGLAFEKPLIETVCAGVLQMEESVTYQAILERGMKDGIQRGLQQGLQQGAAREGQKMVLIAGEQKFGPPTAETQAAIAAITAPERLEALVKKVFRVAGWDELLAGA